MKSGPHEMIVLLFSFFFCVCKQETALLVLKSPSENLLSYFKNIPSALLSMILAQIKK